MKIAFLNRNSLAVVVGAAITTTLLLLLLFAVPSVTAKSTATATDITEAAVDLASTTASAAGVETPLATSLEASGSDPDQDPDSYASDHSCDSHSGTSKDEDSGDSESDEDIYEPPDVEWCRRRPTWKNYAQSSDSDDDESESDMDIRQRCRKVIGYDAPDLITPFDRPLLGAVERCMDAFLATSTTIDINAKTNTTTGTMKKPSVFKMYDRDTDGLVVMAIVEHALCEEEAEAVLAVSDCVKKRFPRMFEKRGFEDTEEGGGNDCTFLGGFLQKLVPGVAARILNNAKLVWETAGWAEDTNMGYDLDLEYDPHTDKVVFDAITNEPPFTDFTTRWWPDPVADTGIRTSEHLSYNKWGILGYHQDAESDYTVLVAMSDPEDYEGGAFSICPHSQFSYRKIYNYTDADEERQDTPECDDKISVKPDRLSAIVFLSEFTHGVEDILTPGRVMFTNELWRYGDVGTAITRPGARGHVLGLHDDDDYDDDDEYDDDDDDDDDDVRYIK